MTITSRLRKVGGSVMVAIPPAVLEMAAFAPGQSVELSAEDNQVILKASRRPKYRLEDLLAQCDPDAPMSQEDLEWNQVQPVGGELI